MSSTGTDHWSPSQITPETSNGPESAARIITKTPSFSHTTLVLQHLHWLLVMFRIQFKILLNTFKAIHNISPPYLSDLLHITTLSRSFCISSSIHPTVSSDCLSTMGSLELSISRYSQYTLFLLLNHNSKHIYSSWLFHCNLLLVSCFFLSFVCCFFFLCIFLL